MSAITPSTLYRESMGSLTLHIATFATASTDTWASAIPSVVGAWAQASSFSTGAVSFVSSATNGTFTITNDQAGPVVLFIVSRS